MWKGGLAVGVCFAGVVGCGAADGPDDEVVASSEQPIIAGTPFEAEDSGFVNLWHGGPGTTGTRDHNSCTGTLLRNDVVLTARHCVTYDRTIGGPLEPDLSTISLRMGSVIVGARAIVDMSPFDAALVVTDRFMRIGTSVHGHEYFLWPNPHADLVGRSAFCYGYGINSSADTTGASADVLRVATLPITGSSTTFINVSGNSSGQGLWRGDSGGGCLAFTATPGGIGFSAVHVTGVNSTCSGPAGVCSQVGPQVLLPTTNANYTSGFIHSSTSSNVFYNQTIIDHPGANGNPNALLQVAHDYGVGGAYAYLAKSLGVYYAGGRWRIFTQDGSTMPVGLRFHVSVGGGFVHRADAASISGHSTFISAPGLDGNPSAAFVVTQNWNPGNVGSTYNNHPIGVWYSNSRAKWAVFNQDFAAMSVGAAFNLRVERTYAVRPTLRAYNYAVLDDPNLNGQPDAHPFVTANYQPGAAGPSAYDPHPLGVWYDTAQARWMIFHENGATMPANTGYNVLVRP